MNITIQKKSTDTSNNYFENYAQRQLEKLFSIYPFIESMRVSLRGQKHPTKKVKLQARLKGKDIFVEAQGEKHDTAINLAADKLRAVAEKYKSKRYRRAS